MILRALFVLILTAVYVFGETEENVNQQVDVGSGGNLVVDVSFGSVDIDAAGGDKVSIQAHREIDMRNEASEKQFLDEAPILISKDGNTVRLTARRKDNRGWSWHGHIEMDAKYTVHVPKNFNLDLRTGGGAISAADVTGTLKAATSGGKLKLTKLHGPIDAKTSGGGIAIADCEGALLVKTSGGGIHSTGGTGSLDARTSGGSIDVRDFKGDTLVRTSGGTLQIDNIGGKVSGETSGGSITASLISPVPGDVDLSSSAGSIVLNVPTDAAINIDARASSGAVANGLSLNTSSNERDELRGTMNGGGKLVILRANAGSVSLRPAPAKTAAR